jgi:hypothetical protein
VDPDKGDILKSEAIHSEALSIHRSFVIRLYAGADPAAGEISGRVEHLVSGEGREFLSTAEFVASLGLLLRAGSGTRDTSVSVEPCKSKP